MDLPSLFHCERLAARMTAAGCGKMWESVERRAPRIGESRMACVGCQIGALNAGRDVEAALRAARAAQIEDVCTDCGATGRRLVGGMRCISCYNRAREAARGKDARGRAPRFATRYHPVTLLVTAPDRQRLVRYDQVSGLAEAAMLAAKGAAGAKIVLSLPRLVPLPPGSMLDLSPDFGPIRGVARGPRFRLPRPRAVILPRQPELLLHVG